MPKKKPNNYRNRRKQFLVSEKRKQLKLQCVEYKGGRCQNCGYNKCINALAFHHLDPSQKDFGITAGGFLRKFENVKEELDKCILVCHNCHSEIHHEEYEKNREVKRLALEAEDKFNKLG